MYGSGHAMFWRLIRSERKKRQICRAVSGLPRRSIVLVEDETDLLLFPPLRAMWSRRGEPAQVMLSGWNARRVVFGCMNLVTGHRLFQLSRHLRADDFHAFMYYIRRQYRGWHITVVLDNNRCHTAISSQDLARQLGIELLWLPKRAPELNPMDALWGQGKDAIVVNKQFTDIDEQAELFVTHLQGLSNQEALRTSGVLSKHFWLKKALPKDFCGPA
jgi:hypothetical protein